MNKARLLLRSRFLYNIDSNKERGRNGCEKLLAWVYFLSLLFFLAGCSKNETTGGIPTAEPPQSDSQHDQHEEETKKDVQMTENMTGAYTTETKISDVIAEPVFDNYGRLIFPVDSSYYSGNTLGNLKLTWYSNIDPEKTVEIANYMKGHAAKWDTTLSL